MGDGQQASGLFDATFDKINLGIRGLSESWLLRKYQNESVFNEYGDRRFIADGYGADISVQRADALDKMAARFVYDQVSKGNAINAIDVGGGVGAQSLRFAALGAEVKLVDIYDQGQNEIVSLENVAFLSAMADNQKLGSVQFINKDIRDVVGANETTSEKFDVVFSQRMWSSMPYADAVDALKHLTRCGDVFFISTIGLDTEIGSDYPHRDKPVEDRWSPYSPAMAEKHGVSGCECLYREDELKRQFEEAGLQVIHTWSSSFGNPRVVAIRPSASPRLRQDIEDMIKAYAPAIA